MYLLKSAHRVHDGSTSLFAITLYDNSQMAERSRIARTKVLHIECDNEIIIGVGLTASSTNWLLSVKYNIQQRISDRPAV